MPRRNRNALDERPVRRVISTEPREPETLDEAAWRLVHAGRCSVLILDHAVGSRPKRDRRA